MASPCSTRRVLAYRKQPLGITLPAGDLTILPFGVADHVREDAYRYLHSRPAPMIWHGRIDHVAQDLAALMHDTLPALEQDIVALTRLYGDVTGRDVVRVRLERVLTDSCRKFHVDHLCLRLLRSYVGPGVQWTRDGGATVQDTPAGSVVFLAGTAHPDWSDSCTARHRSPPMTETQLHLGGRLLLTIDETNLGTKAGGDVLTAPQHRSAPRIVGACADEQDLATVHPSEPEILPERLAERLHPEHAGMSCQDENAVQRVHNARALPDRALKDDADTHVLH